MCAGRAARESVLRAGRDGELAAGALEPLQPVGIGRNQAEQQIGMAREIFRSGFDSQVDAAAMRREEERRRPSVVVMTQAPRACATSAIAGTSCTSSDSEPGDSRNTARVLERNRRRSRRRGADRSRSSRRPCASMCRCKTSASDRRRNRSSANGRRRRLRSSAPWRSPPCRSARARFRSRRRSRSTPRRARPWSACRGCRRCSVALPLL